MAGKPSKRQIAYATEVKEIYASYAGEMTVYGDDVIDLLREIQISITSQINAIPVADWEHLVLTNISRQIDDAMITFQSGYNQVMAESLLTSAQTGQNAVINPLINVLDTSLMAFPPDIFIPAILDPSYNALLQRTATLIKGATEDAARNINAKIIVGMVDGRTKQEVVDGIIGELKGERMGFRTLNDRAWAIFRTENGRMSSIATELQMKSAKQLIPGARKVWLHGVMGGLGQTPRPGHVALDGTSVPVAENFINPVTGEQLLYPHHPLGAASEVISCGCAHVLDMPDDVFLRKNTLVSV